MSTYAIGDVQGCYDELRALLDKINYDPKQDRLWFAGDIINRGPKSLECLRFIKNTPNCFMILGNHDLHAIAVAYGASKIKPYDTLDQILQASDRNELIDWLRQQPLIHHDKTLGFTLSHAGIYPDWNLQDAIQHAHEVEKVLRGDNIADFLNNLYGNEPSKWEPSLEGYNRLRFIVNAFTRMRFCRQDNSLDLNAKGTLQSVTNDLAPWFKVTSRKTQSDKLIFGHWAALECNANTENVFAIDSGCVWGRELTALRLEDETQFSVPAQGIPLK